MNTSMFMIFLLQSRSRICLRSQAEYTTALINLFTVNIKHNISFNVLAFVQRFCRYFCNVHLSSLSRCNILISRLQFVIRQSCIEMYEIQFLTQITIADLLWTNKSPRLIWFDVYNSCKKTFFRELRLLDNF